MAQFIYQALQSLASIKPSNKQSQRTVQQAQAIMERLETTLKKVLDSMRTTVGVGVRSYKVAQEICLTRFDQSVEGFNRY